MVMKKLVFSITDRCNSRCAHCNIWQLRPVNEITLEEIEKFASTNSGKFAWLDITGGEPFLRSDCVEITKIFSRHNKLTFFNTTVNSLMPLEYYARKFEEIAQLGIRYTYVVISLDGYGQIDASQRGIADHFDRAIKLGEELHKLEMKYKNFHFMFGYTMTKLNQGSLIQTIEETKKRLPFVDYRRFHVNYFQTSGIYYHNEQSNLTPDKDATVAELEEYVSRRGMPKSLLDIGQGLYFKTLLHFIKTGKRALPDRPFERSIYLNNYGKLYPSIDWNFLAADIRESAGAYNIDNLSSLDAGKQPEFVTACNDNIQLFDIRNFVKVLLL